MDISRCNGCGEIVSGDDIEYMSDRISTNLITQKYSDPYPVCPYCGSDSLEDMVAKADYYLDRIKEGF